ncbi:waprin-Thr1 [Cryptotermes secundus]|uniref:waprin-Thr1 n=1 Tax=Cryptotermes secundus TaxID=105785 RepID=UPI000CD7D9AC|nr:waprin-Thr1 [Cryptotermes secundus]
MAKSMIALITVFLVTLVLSSNVLSQASKSGYCPMARTVTNCFNRCKSDYECSFDKKCCPNACGSTSCAESSLISYGSEARDYNKSTYCDNVKCHTGEKCVFDTKTKRNRCVRG